MVDPLRLGEGEWCPRGCTDDSGGRQVMVMQPFEMPRRLMCFRGHVFELNAEDVVEGEELVCVHCENAAFMAPKFEVLERGGLA